MPGHREAKLVRSNVQQSVDHREVVVSIRSHRVQGVQPGGHLYRVNGIGILAGTGHDGRAPPARGCRLRVAVTESRAAGTPCPLTSSR